MTFPTIPTVAAGRALTAVQADTTATRTFPSLTGLTKNSGDLLIAICIAYQTSTGTNAAFSGWTGGFTEFHDSATSTTMAIGMAYKFSTGSETGTFAVTQAATITGHATFILLSIPGAHATTPPEAGSRASGTTAAADPASFDPAGWADEDTLWLGVGGSGETATGGSFTGIAGPPTNYTDGIQTTISGDVVGGVEGAVAFRQLNAASEDVGTRSVDISNARNAAVVVAVRPAPLALAPANVAQAQVAQNVVLEVPNNIRSEQSAGTNSGGISFGVSGPDVLVDDTVLLIHAENFYGAANLLTPTGEAVTDWTLVHTLNNGSNNGINAKIWVGKVASTEIASIDLNSTNEDQERYGHVWFLKGSDWSFDVAGNGGGAASTSHVAPSVDPAIVDELLFCFFGAGNSAVFNYTMPGGMVAYTERDVSTIITYRSASQQLTSDAATGTRTATASASVGANGWQAISVLMKPVAGALSLVVQNSNQVQVAQVVTLGVHLAINNSQQAQVAQNVTLGFSLVVQNSQQVQTTENVSLSPTLTIQNSQQAQVAENVSLGVHLVIQNSQQTQVTENVSLSPTLIIQNSQQAQVAQNVVLETAGVAAVTHRNTTSSTLNVESYQSTAFTPAANELLSVFVMAGATAINPTMTDSQGLGMVLVGTTLARSGPSGMIYHFVSQAKAAAVSTTVTFVTATGDPANGTVIAVAGVSGMDKVGTAAIRQTAKQEEQAAATPAPAFSAAALTGNPILGAVGNEDNPANLAPPSTWTEQADTGYATPTTGLEYGSIDDGFTGTTVTWGSASATQFASYIAELDASAGASLTIQNSAQAQASQNVSLAPTLIIQNSQQAQASQNVSLEPTLTIQNSQQAQTAQNVTLDLPGELAIQNSQQAQITTNVSLAPTLAIQNSQQVQTVQNISLAPTLVIQNSQQAQTTTQVSLAPILIIQNSQQAQTSQNVVLAPTLIIQNSAQAQVAQNVTFGAQPGEFHGWGIALR